MKKANLHSIRILLLMGFFSCGSFAQQGKISVHQNPEFEELLAGKRKINASITVNDRYKIQIFNGDSENSKKHLSDFKREFRNLDATVIFNTPYYKVWVGNFKTKIEAERNLLDIQKRYPNALLIRPNK